MPNQYSSYLDTYTIGELVLHDVDSDFAWFHLLEKGLENNDDPQYTSIRKSLDAVYTRYSVNDKTIQRMCADAKKEAVCLA